MNNFLKGVVAALGLLTLSIAIVPAVLAETPDDSATVNLPTDRAAIIAEREQWREQQEERRAEFESMTFEEKKEHMLTRIDENITKLTEVRGQIAAATTEEELLALRGPNMAGEGMGMGGPGMRGNKGFGQVRGNGPAFNNQEDQSSE